MTIFSVLKYKLSAKNFYSLDDKLHFYFPEQNIFNKRFNKIQISEVGDISNIRIDSEGNKDIQKRKSARFNLFTKDQYETVVSDKRIREKTNCGTVTNFRNTMIFNLFLNDKLHQWFEDNLKISGSAGNFLRNTVFNCDYTSTQVDDVWLGEVHRFSFGIGSY
jgi:hypothetical protein|tara:strand:+ start:75 stop:563 length:489 start_codon:yes stop_codon:yes gene_type:complete